MDQMFVWQNKLQVIQSAKVKISQAQQRILQSYQ